MALILEFKLSFFEKESHNLHFHIRRVLLSLECFANIFYKFIQYLSLTGKSYLLPVYPRTKYKIMFQLEPMYAIHK